MPLSLSAKMVTWIANLSTLISSLPVVFLSEGPTGGRFQLDQDAVQNQPKAEGLWNSIAAGGILQLGLPL